MGAAEDAVGQVRAAAPFPLSVQAHAGLGVVSAAGSARGTPSPSGRSPRQPRTCHPVVQDNIFRLARGTAVDIHGVLQHGDDERDDRDDNANGVGAHHRGRRPEPAAPFRSTDVCPFTVMLA